MEMTFWKQLIVSVLGLLFVLVIFGIFLKLRDKDKKSWSVLIAIFGLVVIVSATGFFSGSQVITVDGENEKFSKWVYNFKDGDKTIGLDWGEIYIYNKGNNDCELILYPVYYTENRVLVGTQVKDYKEIEIISLKPGEMRRLNERPHFMFRKPEEKIVSDKSAKEYWCIDRKENVDTTILNYRPLRVEYTTDIQYY